MHRHKHKQAYRHFSSTSAVLQQMEPLTFAAEHEAFHLAGAAVIVPVTHTASVPPELNVWSLFQYQTS